jgi:hypothetical protein
MRTGLVSNKLRGFGLAALLVSVAAPSSGDRYRRMRAQRRSSQVQPRASDSAHLEGGHPRIRFRSNRVEPIQVTP